jgi:hypothetical protein
VTVNELVQGVHMALGGHAVDCTAFDADDAGTVDLSSLILSVGYALHGCP